MLYAKFNGHLDAEVHLTTRSWVMSFRRTSNSNYLGYVIIVTAESDVAISANKKADEGKKNIQLQKLPKYNNWIHLGRPRAKIRA